MWSRLKTVFKTTILPTVVSIFRVNTQLGGSFFGTRTSFEHFGLKNHPAEALVCYTAAAVSGGDALVNNVPYIYNYCNSTASDATDTIPPATQLKPSTRIFYEIFRQAGPTSFVTYALSTYIGAYTFALTFLSFYNGKYSAEQENEAMSYALLSTITNLCFQFWLRNSFIERNVRRFAHALQNKDIHFDARLTKATLLSLHNIGTPCIAYFSTDSSLTHLPYVTLSKTMRISISGISGIVALIATFFTECTSIYDAIGNKPNQYDKLPQWEPLTRTLSYFWGAANALINYPVYTYIAVASTAQSLGLNPYSPLIITIGIGCAGLKPISVFTFSARQTYLGLLDNWLKKHGYTVKRIEEPDLEKGLPPEEHSPLLSAPTPFNSPASTVFTFNTLEEIYSDSQYGLQEPSSPTSVSRVISLEEIDSKYELPSQPVYGSINSPTFYRLPASHTNVEGEDNKSSPHQTWRKAFCC